MIHELKEIIGQAVINQQKGLKNVLASVVHLDGSSYRKPGVRMLIGGRFINYWRGEWWMCRKRNYSQS